MHRIGDRLYELSATCYHTWNQWLAGGLTSEEFLRSAIPGVFSTDKDSPIIWSKLRLHNIDQSRLSGTVWSNESRDVVLGQTKRNVVDSMVLTKPLVDMEDSKQVFFVLFNTLLFSYDAFGHESSKEFVIFLSFLSSITAEHGDISLEPHNEEEQDHHLQKQVQNRTTVGINRSRRHQLSIATGNKHDVQIQHTCSEDVGNR